jgi:hypothetical protein
MVLSSTELLPATAAPLSTFSRLRQPTSFFDLSGQPPKVDGEGNGHQEDGPLSGVRDKGKSSNSAGGTTGLGGGWLVAPLNNGQGNSEDEMLGGGTGSGSGPPPSSPPSSRSLRGLSGSFGSFDFDDDDADGGFCKSSSDDLRARQSTGSGSWGDADAFGALLEQHSPTLSNAFPNDQSLGHAASLDASKAAPGKRTKGAKAHNSLPARAVTAKAVTAKTTATKALAAAKAAAVKAAATAAKASKVAAAYAATATIVSAAAAFARSGIGPNTSSGRPRSGSSAGAPGGGGGGSAGDRKSSKAHKYRCGRCGKAKAKHKCQETVVCRDIDSQAHDGPGVLTAALLAELCATGGAATASAHNGDIEWWASGGGGPRGGRVVVVRPWVHSEAAAAAEAVAARAVEAARRQRGGTGLAGRTRRGAALVAEFSDEVEPGV